ncbi:MAG TPA: hypothetical protein DCL44_12250 [Elusimicrobia bacterium]|nr:hypothetical protein [Elusimicrobiota bacterium]
MEKNDSNYNFWVKQTIRRIWATLKLAGRRFLRIDGVERAGAFAYNAFFSLFPLIVIVVTLTSTVINRDQAGNDVIGYIGKHVLLSGEMQLYILTTISGVVNARQQAGIVAFLMLLWVAIQFLSTLVQATNRAWNLEGDKWWRMPLKSLFLLLATVVAVFVGMGVPALIKMMNRFLPALGFLSWVDGLAAFLLPWLVFFFCVSFFYQMAPRRRTYFSEVWVSALCSTALLLSAQRLFIIYLKDFAALNAVYGAFGGIMALLLWIYLSGCILIFGACLCAAQAETRIAQNSNRGILGN